MIRSIKLMFGRSPGAMAELIAASSITVFVGPNNSGKSRVLKEIYRHVCSGGGQGGGDLLLSDLIFEGFSQPAAEELLKTYQQSPLPGEFLRPGQEIYGKSNNRILTTRAQMMATLTNPRTNKASFAEWYLRANTLILDGQSRIAHVQMQEAGDLQSVPASSLQVLFRDDIKRAEWRRIIRDAFGLFAVVDPTNLGKLRIRLSPEPPPTTLVERGIHDEAVRFHSRALPIEEGSDGIKAFTGLITEIIAGDPDVLLIDEPEAFLHPALASLLGKELARAVSSSEKKLFVSTHSPNFVMGCVQSGAPVSIVRLTYRSGVPTARVLPNEDLLRLMRNPLLRSTGVLSGLFYESVIVAESDADRAFYQEINDRLLRFEPDCGIPNCLFLNAQNKQTVPTIVAPLRQMGIPAAGIVDVDVLKDGGSVWSALLDAAGIPPLEHPALAATRTAAKARFDATGKDMKRSGGVALLSGQDKEAVENLFAKLAEYGMFVVPGGELESWLRNLSASGHGPQWLISMFQLLGENPDASSYVRPAHDDVWKFVSAMKGWLLDPNRRGIPT